MSFYHIADTEATIAQKDSRRVAPEARKKVARGKCEARRPWNRSN